MWRMVERLRRDGDDEDERGVARFMASLAAATAECVPAPPQAQAIWLKAQLLRRWEAERRVELPLDRMESVHVAIGLAAAVLLAVWSAPVLRSLSWFQP